MSATTEKTAVASLVVCKHFTTQQKEVSGFTATNTTHNTSLLTKGSPSKAENTDKVH